MTADTPDDSVPPELAQMAGAGAMPDMGALLGQAMQMQEQLLAAQAQAAQTEVEGVSGGGMVRITLTGELDVRAVSIDPQVVDPDDVDMLQDLVLAALRDAVARVDEMRNAALGGGMPDPSALLGQLGGIGLGGGADPSALLSGLLGDDPDSDDDDD